MKKNEEVPSENIEKKETIISQSFKKEINKDFQIMLTQLESLRQEAYVSLNSLNKNQIIELKSLVNPPELVNLAMQCICILLGVEAKKKLNETEPNYWNETKNLLNNPNIFLENLKNLDLAYVSDKVVEKISLIIISNPNLDVENLQNYSTAAHSLFIWLTNIIKTHHLSKKVELYKKDNNMKEETFKNQKQTVKSQNEGIMGNEKNLIQETSKEKSLQNINTNTEEIEENNNISKIDENDILKEMLPLMQKAKEILNSLDKRGIAEIKAMRKLPQKISLVLQCLSILFGCTHEQEQDVRAILHDINFLNRLAQFDLNEISDDRIKNLALFFDSNPELTIPTINALSQFASQIFKWILTICRCHYFFKLLQVNKPQNFSEKKSNQIVEEKKPDTIKTVTEIYEYENEPFEKTQDLIDEKVLKDTINELNNLDKEVLSQLNLYVKPPNIIGLTMTLVCMVLQNDSEKITKNPYENWKEARKLLGDTKHLIERLVQFDEKNLSEKVVNEIMKSLASVENCEIKILKYSSEAGCLIKWVKAICNCYTSKLKE